MLFFYFPRPYLSSCIITIFISPLSNITERMSFKTLSLSALSVCKHCRLHFSSTGLASGRFLNEKTTQRDTVKSTQRLELGSAIYRAKSSSNFKPLVRHFQNFLIRFFLRFSYILII